MDGDRRLCSIAATGLPAADSRPPVEKEPCTPASASADIFIDRNPIMLDSKIMMTHYSAELVFSDEARARFVIPTWIRSRETSPEVSSQWTRTASRILGTTRVAHPGRGFIAGLADCST